LFFKRWYNRQSAIGNRQSAIGNIKICNNNFKKFADSRISHLRSLHQLALKTLAGFCFAAAVSTPVWAQQTISCTTDPAVFNTGIAKDSSGNYSANSLALNLGNPANTSGEQDEQWKYYHEPPGSTNRDEVPSSFLNLASLSPAHVFYGLDNKRTKPTSGNAQWSGNYPTAQTGIYWFIYEFNLDPGVDPDAFNASLRLNADDNIYHVFVNDADNLSLPKGGFLTRGNYNNDPAFVALDRGWQAGPNRIAVVVDNTTGYAGLMVQPGAVLCVKRSSPVPTFDSLGYWLTGLGVLALAVMTMRRRRAMAN
jgi:hypothetical protein